MPSDTSIKSNKSSKPHKSSSGGQQKNKSTLSVGSVGKRSSSHQGNSSHSNSGQSSARASQSEERKPNRKWSSQSIRYDEKNGYIMLKDVEGTALDSDEYYEYLYEDLIDLQGATASRLVSKETVKIKFDDERNEICPICHVKAADCPHIINREAPNGEKNDNAAGIKIRVRKKKKKDDDTASVDPKK